MKKNKRKSNLKSTLLLLLLTAILLIASSYAWFTSNKTVSVDTIQVNVAATNGLQISTDATTWKSVITPDEIKAGYTGHINQLPAVLQPCSTDGTVAGGKMNMFFGEVKATDDGGFTLTSTKETDTAGTTGNYIAFDMFLKVDQTTDVYMTTGSKVSAVGTSAGLENSARVAFINEGTGNVGDTGALQALTGGSSAVIWEPNNNAHTALGIANALDVYHKTITASEVLPSYFGVKSAFDGVALDNEDTDKFAEVTPNIKTGTMTPAGTTFFKLTAGVTKFRVYMWIEGQDIDCENGASGRDITFDLQFSTDNTL